MEKTVIAMPTITNLHAREILDSRGNPTLEVELTAETIHQLAAVPSGASTGKHEALELRDGGTRFRGYGVQKAVHNVNTIIAPLLQGIDVSRQEEIDTLMIEKDGTSNKKKLGANAILGVSIAGCKAGAEANNQLLFEYINAIFPGKRTISLPRPFFNIINGGRHADNELSFQEFMIAPRMSSFAENLRVVSEVYHILKRILHQKYGKGSTNVGDEGGFAPEPLQHAPEALSLLMKAINQAGYSGKVDLAIDCAASELFIRGKYKVDGRIMATAELTRYYLDLIKKYPIISLEDPFQQDDFVSFAELRKKTKIQIVGDDLTVTNIQRIEHAIKEKSCNCLLLKINQIGTITEALAAARLAYEQGWKVMVSHRSGETEDTFIADLAVGIGAEFIKAGAPCRGERVSKYNQLLRIEELIRKR